MEAGDTMKIKYIQLGEKENKNVSANNFSNAVADLDIPINIIDE